MILGVIPARGGSKGVPRKNIKPIAGAPLVAWTIAAALKSKLMDRFVVSTEDPEIAAIARAYGAEVLNRPPELAQDEVISRKVLEHAIDTLGADAVVLLQATNPIRRPGLIDRVIESYLKGDWDSLATGFSWLLYPPHGVEHRRQDLQTVFVNDGSVIVSKAATIKNQSLFGQKAGTLITSREENVDIDEPFDFWLAEKILEKASLEGWMTCPVKVS
ncbi:MAG: acylneuraminate cytidylyltransferase family protein [Deltaproteobacteria bacterium]|jgi:CMP-N-acetylneuraminic acid synthetase|nr:acylneuraminate cytidylyltransferase family protein [Deltaproteobacteria bacterium]